MSSPHDFDFFHGTWSVLHRRRTGFLDPGSDWEEFPGRSECRALFDGAANIDEIDMPHLGAKGLTLRLFDPVREEWSLNWASSRSGTLFPPVFGRFQGPRGEFHGVDTLPQVLGSARTGGTPIGEDVRVRFVWSGISPGTARWEQAFSTDGGETWLTNWIMEFTRARDSLTASGTPGA
ncbi:hypothetical protein [Streptomyces swartbergensis]|uniref:DUF1579 domain-containing protein n=1 Tax=Streptomyces swartbergensis TaxID=487165 RepID=A0A243SA74_9ACTN|nr:hypothetical protein [Streptomyces swartbergensis]OUD04552.1 hypothetical protein CA983_03610 [Streptomyces swartbergensis]